MRKSLLTFLLAILLLAACGTAPGRLSIDADGVPFDREQVTAAAAPLITRGAAVAVVVVASGDSSGDDLSRRLDTAGLLRDGKIAPDAIAIYISFTPRYSELRAGSRWSKQLSEERLRSIRTEQLNPSLRAEASSAGIAASLTALEAALDQPQPPQGGGAMLWLVGLIGLGLLILLFGQSISQSSDRLLDWLAVSPPARLIAWLWVNSPPGRRQARRRLDQEVLSARRRLDQAVERAYTKIQEAEKKLPPEFATSLATALQYLDQDLEDLAERQQPYAGLPVELKHLATTYDTAEQLADDYVELAAIAADVRGRVEKIRGALAHQQPRRRAQKGRLDAWNTRLAGVASRLRELEQRCARLAPGTNINTLAERVKRQINSYRSLQTEAAELWKEITPAESKAAIAAVRSDLERLRWMQLERSNSSTDSSTTPSSSSGSFDWSSDNFDRGSDSGSPSRDGGEW